MSESGPSAGSPTHALCCHVEHPSHSVMASPSSSTAPQTQRTCTASTYFTFNGKGSGFASGLDVPRRFIVTPNILKDC